MQKLLRLLADPTRLRILAAVAPEELAVNEIADTLAMGQPRISNHLRLLREAGALEDRREGAWTFYRNALPERPLVAPLWGAVEAARSELPELAADAGRRAAVLERRRERSRSHFAAAPADGTSVDEHVQDFDPLLSFESPWSEPLAPEPTPAASAELTVATEAAEAPDLTIEPAAPELSLPDPVPAAPADEPATAEATVSDERAFLAAVDAW